MSRHLLLVGALLVVAAALMIGVPSTVKAQGKVPNRFIQLEQVGPVPGGELVNVPPTGHLIIFQYDDGRFAPDARIEFSVNNLVWQNLGGAYTLYASTPTLPRCRAMTFNTSAGSYAFSSFAFLCEDRLSPAWLTDDVMIEVYFEADDGSDAPDVGGALVLRGFSSAP